MAVTPRNPSIGSTAGSVFTRRVSASTDATVTLFEDTFIESVTTDLALHVPVVGTRWVDALGQGVHVIGGSTLARCIGEHHGDAGSTTVAVDGAVRFNAGPFSSTQFPSTDLTLDVIGRFTNSSGSSDGSPIIFWGLGAGKQSSDDVDNGWVFAWLANNSGWELLQQETSAINVVPQAWPGDDTYMKLSVRSSGAIGSYSTDGVTYNTVTSMDSSWVSTAGIYAQLYYGNFTNTDDPADCSYFQVVTT